MCFSVLKNIAGSSSVRYLGPEKRQVRYAGALPPAIDNFRRAFSCVPTDSPLSSADGLTFNPEVVSIGDLVWLTVSDNRGNSMKRKCWLVPSTLDHV